MIMFSIYFIIIINNKSQSIDCIGPMISLKNQHVQHYLPLAIQTVLGQKPNQPLSKNQKVLVTKIVKNINILCKMNKKEVIEFVKNNPVYQPTLAELYFDKSINNWRLITNDNYPSQEAILLMTDSNECVGIDYRIQFTLSTISKKKVMKPVILLIFQLKKRTFKAYFTLKQFSQFRYKVAEALKSLYTIEMRTLFG